MTLAKSTDLFRDRINPISQDLSRGKKSKHRHHTLTTKLDAIVAKEEKGVRQEGIEPPPQPWKG